MLKVRDSASVGEVSVGDSAVECELDKLGGRQEACRQAIRMARRPRPHNKTDSRMCDEHTRASLNWR